MLQLQLLGLLMDIVAQHRMDRELEARAREAGQSVYAQWLKEDLLYADSFWRINRDGGIQLLSQRDWDITINTDGDGHIVSYTVTRREAADGGS